MEETKPKQKFSRNNILIAVALLAVIIFIVNRCVSETVKPHLEIPPPELIEFTQTNVEPPDDEGRPTGPVLLRVDESATESEIFDLGLWLVRYPGVHVGYWIFQGDKQVAYASRGFGVKTRQLAGWERCKGDERGYVAWYPDMKTRFEVSHSISTDGIIELYETDRTEKFTDEKGRTNIPISSIATDIKDRCAYWGMEWAEFNWLDE